MRAQAAGQLAPANRASQAALEARLAQAARTRRGTHAAFALLLGLSGSVWCAAGLLSSGVQLWADPGRSSGFAAGHGPWPVLLCLLCGGLAAWAFWRETRLDAVHLADALDSAEGHLGELRTAYELCRSRPSHPLLPALCQRTLSRPPGPGRWRALSPPAWVGLLPLLLSSALLLQSLESRGQPPAGLPQLLEAAASDLEQAGSLAAAEVLRTTEQGSPAARQAQADLARAAFARASSALAGAALRSREARGERAVAARLEEADARLRELESARFSSGPAAPAIAAARARLDAARLLAAPLRGPSPTTGTQAAPPGGPGAAQPPADELAGAAPPGPGREQASAPGPAAPGPAGAASGDRQGDPGAGETAAAPPAQGLAGAASGTPAEPPPGQALSPASGSGPGPLPAGTDPALTGPRPGSSAPGPLFGASEAPVVAAWVALRSGRPAF